ncbi:MAG: hypothetical protein OEZ06_27550 [Myxococcales bacterium]|nr:hypothetical protein [Myxococcales bacterium]
MMHLVFRCPEPITEDTARRVAAALLDAGAVHPQALDSFPECAPGRCLLPLQVHTDRFSEARRVLLDELGAEILWSHEGAEGAEVGDDHEARFIGSPPPTTTETPFPVDGYPAILDDFDYNDFGFELRFESALDDDEQSLLSSSHSRWLEAYESDSSTCYRNTGCEIADDRRSAFFWVDRFNYPGTVAQVVHHALWIARQVGTILPVKRVIFRPPDMDTKFGRLGMPVLELEPGRSLWQSGAQRPGWGLLNAAVLISLLTHLISEMPTRMRVRDAIYVLFPWTIYYVSRQWLRPRPWARRWLLSTSGLAVVSATAYAAMLSGVGADPTMGREAAIAHLEQLGYASMYTGYATLACLFGFGHQYIAAGSPGAGNTDDSDN